MNSRKVALIPCLILLVSSASAYYIGMAPSQRNLGTVERGQSYDLSIYLTSDTETPIEVEPSAVTASVSNLKNLDTVDYFDIEEYSGEKISSWFEFSSSTYTVAPVRQRSVKLEGGGSLDIRGQINYTLDVPRAAEPGYHVARIELDPESAEGEGARVSTISLSQHYVFFRVPGKVERELSVRDIRALRTDEDAVRISAEVENTGTVTMQVQGSGKIRTGDGKQSLDMGLKRISPGETASMKTTWSRIESQIEAGNYRLRGTLNYATGKAFIDETVSVTDFIQIESGSNTSNSKILPEGQGKSSLPVWLIAMFLIIVGSLLYAFDIDPLLIFMLLGVLGIGSVIYFSSLPLYLMGVLLAAAGVLLYVGWL